MAKQNKPEYSDPRKQVAAKMRANGHSQREAALTAGYSSDKVVARLEHVDDAEYWYWYKLYEKEFVKEATAEAMRVMRMNLRTKFSVMSEKDVQDFIMENGMSRYEFEQISAREREGAVKTAIGIRADDVKRRPSQLQVQMIGGFQAGSFPAEILQGRHEEIPPPPPDWENPKFLTPAVKDAVAEADSDSEIEGQVIDIEVVEVEDAER